MRITVIGSGVTGLTCAVALLEAGAEVHVLTAAAPTGTVSAVAGAMLGPVFGAGGERSLAWERHSDEVFRDLAADPTTGVRLLTGRLLSAPELGPDLPPWTETVPGFRGVLGGGDLPDGFSAGFAAAVPFADMPRYLAWLVRRVGDLGGGIEQRIVSDLGEADPAADVVVNCTGLGASRLTGDTGLQPVWGQQIAADTIERAARAVPAVRSAPVLGVEVGLRPGRADVRLDAEARSSTTVIHNYGHDGSGVFWSWGCASDVVRLCGLHPGPSD